MTHDTDFSVEGTEQEDTHLVTVQQEDAHLVTVHVTEPEQDDITQ